MRLAEHLISFHNEFNKFNNTGARMIDSIYHRTSKLLKNWRENVKILPPFNGRHYVTLLNL